MSNDGRERGTIKFGDVKVVDNAMTVPELPGKGQHWAGKWPTCALMENDRIMVGYNEGNTYKARVRKTWRSEQKGPNYGRYVVSFVYADNQSPDFDGQPGTEWADDVYPLGAQVTIGYGSDERGFLVFADWQRAEDYVTKHNARVADETALEIEGLRVEGEKDYTPEYLAEYSNTLIMDREAHLVPVIMVPEWTVTPSIEIC